MSMWPDDPEDLKRKPAFKVNWEEVGPELLAAFQLFQARLPSGQEPFLTAEEMLQIDKTIAKAKGEAKS